MQSFSHVAIIIISLFLTVYFAANAFKNPPQILFSKTIKINPERIRLCRIILSFVFFAYAIFRSYVYVLIRHEHQVTHIISISVAVLLLCFASVLLIAKQR